MKKLNLKGMLAAIAIVALGGFGTQTVEAQKVETLNVGVKARLANQLTVTKVSDVDFGGIFIPLSTTATVTLDHTNNVTLTSGTTSFYSTDLRRSGQFYVTADKTSTFTIQYPLAVDLFNDTKESKLTYNPAFFDADGTAVASSSETEYNISNETYKTYYIGGLLEVASANTSGEYNGDFNVSITWK
jgi:hypothetical protein